MTPDSPLRTRKARGPRIRAIVAGLGAGAALAAILHEVVLVELTRSVLAGGLAATCTACGLLVSGPTAQRLQWPPSPGVERSAGFHLVALRASMLRQQAVQARRDGAGPTGGRRRGGR